MIAPLSWLKQYIDITVSPEKLGERLTEVGLGTEHITKTQKDTIFDLEVTPNRPDWLSMMGIAREIAAIENKRVKYPKLKTNLKPKKGVRILPLTIHPNFEACARMTGIIINNIRVDQSPQWLKERLVSIGQRPINNIVDITNFVMFELGNPIHSFDYHKIVKNEMWVKQALGGELFESVDEVTYHLPKGAIIYKDSEKIFDLAGIKGGKNSGTYKDTKAVFILVPVDDSVLIRKASQALGLRSEASSIFERKVNKGGTIDALKRTIDLILEIAGGEIASNLIDLKKEDFKPWKLSLRLNRLESMLGIKIPDKEVTDILERLNLSPSLRANAKQSQTIECTIPTYRNDLQIEEDLIEEVARLYGYNNFPKTQISAQIPTQEVPYFKNYAQDLKIKNIVTAVGFSEIYTYSLVSEADIVSVGINPEKMLRVDNPVSREFEYLRPTLKINLLKALKENRANFDNIHLFELGKVYLGSSLDKTSETYMLSAVSNTKNYFHIKGLLEKIGETIGVTIDTSKYIHIIDEGVFFELPYSELMNMPKKQKTFIPLPKYPPVVEDIAFIVRDSVKTGEIIETILDQSRLIADVSLLDQYESTKTFHIVFRDKNKNLTTEEVAKIREKILSSLDKKFGIKVK